MLIRARGKRIPQWKADELGVVGVLPDSPVTVNVDVEAIELIPMGAARLRISQFPVIGETDGTDAWKQVEAMR